MIALDAYTDLGIATAAHALSGAVVVGSGANPRMFVGIFATTGFPGDPTVTYNSVGLALVDSHVCGSGSAKVWVYELVGPAAGSHSLSISWASGSFTTKALCAVYSGVTIGALDSHSSNGGDNDCTVSTTVVADNCWVLGFAGYQAGTFRLFAGSFTDELKNTTTNVVSLVDTNGIVVAGSKSCHWGDNTGGGGQIGGVLLSFAPFVAAGGGTLSLMGV